MNVAVRDVRVDPMFVRLCRVHGLNDAARKVAEKVVHLRPKSAPRAEPPSDIVVELCSPSGIVRRDWLLIYESKNPNTILVRDIIRVVADLSGLTSNDILSNRRDAKSCLARHIAMYLAKRLTAHSLPRIGKLMGGKDHTTVLHALRRIQAMLDAGNESLSEFLSNAGAKLEGGN